MKKSLTTFPSTKRHISIRTGRNNGKITRILSKERLKWLYYKENKSLYDIAKEYGLKRRTLSKAQIEAVKKAKFEMAEKGIFNKEDVLETVKVGNLEIKKMVWGIYYVEWFGTVFP